MRSTAVLLLLLPAALSAQQAPPPVPVWNVTLGAGAAVIPRYAGSDESRVLPIPLAEVTWRDRVYLGRSRTGLGGALGAYAVRSPAFGLGAELAVLDNRPADRADNLAGMEDRDVVASAGLSASYRTGPLELTLGGAQGLNDDAGLLGTGQLAYERVVGRRMLVTLGVGATVASARQMRREFGVSPAEAARRQALIDAGDDRLESDEGRAYRPDGGLRSIGASLSVAVALSPAWSILGFGGVDRLSDRASDSPLVRRREQFSGGVGVVVRP